MISDGEIGLNEVSNLSIEVEGVNLPVVVNWCLRVSQPLHVVVRGPSPSRRGRWRWCHLSRRGWNNSLSIVIGAQSCNSGVGQVNTNGSQIQIWVKARGQLA
jgi:hypothetical protein